MSVKLARWGLHFYALPYRREIVWANAVEKQGVYALLVIEGDNGSRGVAEGTIKATWSGVSPNSLKAAFEDFLMPKLQGVDISAPAAVQAALAGIPENKLAKGMIDSAAWTLHAATLGKPLWQLWSSAPDATGEVDLTWAITRQPPAAMAAEAAAVCVRDGFRTLKVKGGQGLATDLQAMHAIRSRLRSALGDAAGDAVILYVDANSAYSRAEALDYVKAIADAGATVAEDPCSLWPDETFAALQAQSPIPLLVDRNCTSLADAHAFLARADAGKVALSTKPGRIGLSEARAINDFAATHSAKVAIGLYAESALGTLISLQQAAALADSQTLVAAEQSFFQELTSQVLAQPLQLHDGRIRLPRDCDLAAAIDWEMVARFALA